MKRLYEQVAKEHFRQHRQMLFLMGPRQVGKTTTSIAIAEAEDPYCYLNWDDLDQRAVVLAGPSAVAKAAGYDKLAPTRPILVLDEIHKYADWKIFLKGFYDSYGKHLCIIVTGSARLDVFQRGGDSLMGRYLPYRFHALSLAEIIHASPPKDEFRSQPKPIEDDLYKHLLEYGGCPDPFLKANPTFFNQWRRLRIHQLFREDLRDLTRIQELDRLEVLAQLLAMQVGQLTTYEALAKKLRVANKTVRRWVEALKRVYYCYDVRPWSSNVSRSLLKEPKFYLWDWSQCTDPGARAENFIASHLLKAVHFWTDCGLGDYGLYFVRDKEKREVDFLVTRNAKPWILIEAKQSANHSLSPVLCHFQSRLNVPHAFQVVVDMPYVDANCFEQKRPCIVPARTLLSQLV